jgi:hypothetical protein
VGILLELGAAVAVASPAPSHGAKPALRIRVPDAAGMAVRRALLVARQRLGTARCRGVLADFRSAARDRPLAEVLEGLGQTAEQHLDALRFEDGARHARCASPAILAFTHPGSDTVYVCPSQFKSAVRNDAAYAEMILIHEWLHTLGLGENPPTSLEITARVTERCGDALGRRASPPSAAELDDPLGPPIASVHGVENQLISHSGLGEDLSEVDLDDRSVQESGPWIGQDLPASAQGHREGNPGRRRGARIAMDKGQDPAGFDGEGLKVHRQTVEEERVAVEVPARGVLGNELVAGEEKGRSE